MTSDTTNPPPVPYVDPAVSEIARQTSYQKYQPAVYEQAVAKANPLGVALEGGRHNVGGVLVDAEGQPIREGEPG